MKRLLLFTGFAASIFVSMQCSQQKTERSQTELIPDSVYIREGNIIVTKTFDTLRSTLTLTMAEKGFVQAISLCNEAAYPITLVYAKEGITIRRASDRYRNPKNMADSLESAILAEFKKDRSPRVVRMKDEVHYIKPIVVQAMCLYCHGLPDTEIKPEVLAAIREKYPDDRATGYREGDLRGLWHVVFKAKQE